MRFRRKSSAEDAPAEAEGTPAEPTEGPYDADAVPDDGLERVDLGSLLIAPAEGRELRMQVDEASGAVQAVILAGAEGAIELRAFAAPRNGDLWSEVRPKIAADMSQRGGTASEREGRFGTELQCQIQVRRPEGNGVQVSRIVGINGPRWLLRATFLGRPAIELDTDDTRQWEHLLTTVAVQRGTGPMMVGEPLPLVLPESARRVGPADQNRPAGA
ncbi:DUF3710 domain-containing protein [Nocardioides litoris]|uniref:DUF3710 domain-containing protein n=1 Tax=Nocardioides litoris TaxID=1926648 RepID=UPI001123466D|nr:DUF3710 domain-containing protein [Nocardioides litoris]